MKNAKNDGFCLCLKSVRNLVKMTILDFRNPLIPFVGFENAMVRVNATFFQVVDLMEVFRDDMTDEQWDFLNRNMDDIHSAISNAHYEFEQMIRVVAFN